MRENWKHLEMRVVDFLEPKTFFCFAIHPFHRTKCVDDTSERDPASFSSKKQNISAKVAAHKDLQKHNLRNV